METTLHVDLFVCVRIIGSNFAVASGLPKSIDGCFELDKLQMEPAEVVEKENVVESKLFMKELTRFVSSFRRYAVIRKFLSVRNCSRCSTLRKICP